MKLNSGQTSFIGLFFIILLMIDSATLRLVDNDMALGLGLVALLISIIAGFINLRHDRSRLGMFSLVASILFLFLIISGVVRKVL